MKTIEELQAIIDELTERLQSSQSAIESAVETLDEEGNRGTIYLELCGELAPNEELLIKIEKP